MEHLTKQQIVLLTLFTSFVTSLATGIITVSLMEQAPVGVTQTINRVVERTIERVVSDAPSSHTAAVVESVNGINDAVALVSKSIVRIKPLGGSPDSVTGIGLVLSEAGLFIADKASLAVPGKPLDEHALGKGMVAVVSTGEEYPIQIVQSEIIGDNAFAAVLIPKDMKLVPVTSASANTSMKLGDRVFALSGKRSSTLEEGIIKKVPESPTEVIETTVPSTGLLLGSPLFTETGEVIGYKTTSLIDKASFNQVSGLKSITPFFAR